jgi:hypothetical protein
MKRRFVAALIVVLAVLFSQGGGHVLAAICPHLRAAEQPENSCHNNSPDKGSEKVAEHHHSEHNQPDESQGAAFEPSGVRCNHCVVHSRSKREDPALQQAPVSPRADDQKSAVPVVKLEPPSFLNTIAWNARAQGPPGPTAPLHILLNVFRI